MSAQIVGWKSQNSSLTCSCYSDAEDTDNHYLVSFRVPSNAARSISRTSSRVRSCRSVRPGTVRTKNCSPQLRHVPPTCGCRANGALHHGHSALVAGIIIQSFESPLPQGSKCLNESGADTVNHYTRANTAVRLERPALLTAYTSAAMATRHCCTNRSQVSIRAGSPAACAAPHSFSQYASCSLISTSAFSGMGAYDIFGGAR